MTLVHHQFFWIGMRMGFTMRQQVVAAIHAKVLRLNSAAVAHANSGTIINLASNDVRRFDEGFSFWLFCWAGPVEAAMVLLMVSLELGFVPAVCGMAAMLAVIPMQALLVRTVAGLRRNTAARTDERVRLTGEVVQGCLAMKMLGWEDSFAKAICAIRGREVSYSQRMAQIRGLNITLQFIMTPVVAFVTFSVYKALNGTLYLPSVFYALSLLNLPKLFLVYFAVLGFQYMTETWIAVQRIDKFLSMPEPPPPVHMRAKPAAKEEATPETANRATKYAGVSPVASTFAADGRDENDTQGLQQKQQGSQQQQPRQRKPLQWQQWWGRRNQQQRPSTSSENGAATSYPDGYVELGRADYDWNTNVEEMAAQDGSHHPQNAPTLTLAASDARANKAVSAASAANQSQQPPSSTALSSLMHRLSSTTTRSSLEPPVPLRQTLTGIRLIVQPGELLAVIGEVGSGKSSLLAALLGELMPIRSREGTVQGGPIVVGGVAYCSQVPWIMAATLRENITFQTPYDQQRYDAVIEACALQQDLSELPAGDQTELGERGINLSGGQKARVALARAAYSRASVQLLDDPLSAVDPRVGRILFNQCIGPEGVLAGTTRILVTHQRQYLPQCDRVAVLREGILVASGTWAEVALLQLPELVGGTVTIELDDAAAEAAEEEILKSNEQQVQQDDTVQQQNGKQQQPACVQVEVASSSAESDQQVISAQQQQQAGNFGEIHQHNSVGTESSANEHAAAELENSELSRIRTMAPDINMRPADSSRAAGWGLWARLNPSRVGRSFVRAVSSVIGRNNSKFKDTAVGGVAGDDLESDSSFAVYYQQHRQAGLFEMIGASISRSLSSLFIPPAYLPGGSHYVPPEHLYKDIGSRSLKSQFSAVGLAKLGPVRSLFTHALADQNGSRVAAKAAATAANGKAASGKGVGVPASAAASEDAGQHDGKLVIAEAREAGSVSWRVYGAYAKQLGPITSVVLVAALVAGQGIAVAGDWWLAKWSSSPPAVQTQDSWLTVYGILTGGVVAVSLLRSALFFWATMVAATRIHNGMLHRVLRAPLAFFHTNPAGRVLNRFSNDQGRVDDVLPLVMFDVLQTGFVCLGAFVLVAIAVPFILPIFAALLITFYYFKQRYIFTSREVKRWESTSKSPVYASFSATLKGLSTIRAFGAESHFQDTFIRHLSLNGQWWYAYLGTSRWIGFRLDCISTITLLATAFLAMAVRQQVSAAIVALALTYVLQLTGTLQWWTRQSVEVENNMTSVERMVEYMNLPQEPPRLSDGAAAPPPGWPKSGAIIYHNVTASYRPGLPAVLKDLSFYLAPGCSCGVVGRTGSGKSSLMLTLFRLIDITAGSILLDGVDTASIGVDALRQQLAIIPQDPVLFSGTLRSNLDPWSQHDDAALWRVLAAVQLKSAIRAAGGLHVRMAEAGDNLSVGQRQLFCLARALLQEARVLALDEATANVDRATDALIQQSLRDFAGGPEGKASGRVLLVIAHRIDTILDCDHLLVLSAGRLVEQGPPQQLASSGSGVFAGMVQAAKAASADHHH
eukprot:GHRR01018328.1.p1 GENE.GHRR01018328.1~~GHRR01018328.1.p1  ORF type:complete len:1541 (+),score=583.94 GHRR01018328.1:446-5068(+)